MSQLWLYLHFSSLQLDSLYAELNQPVVVLDKAKNRIIQLNLAASECGIQHGMGLGAAASLHHNLQVAEYQQSMESDKLKDIAAWLYGCTSDIALWPPNGLLLRVHPMLSLYGGLEPYWRAVKQRLQPLELNYTYACAQTPLGARILARHGHKLISQTPDTLDDAIGNCPLSATDLSTKQQHQLSRVGIKRVSELMTIRADQLSRRFSHDLAIYIGRLSGHFSHPQTFYYPAPKFRQAVALLYGIDNSQRLLPPIKTLLQRLEQFLRLHDKLTTRLQLHFTQQDNSIIELWIVSAQPEYQAEHWEALMTLKLEGLQLSEPIHSIMLKVTELQEKQQLYQDIFAGKQGRQTSLQLVSLLQAKLGTNAIKGLCIGDDFRPERASNYSSPGFTESGPVDWPLPSMRPTLLCDPPFCLNEKVSLLHGPERIQTGWWDNQPVHRDYFIARSIQGKWLWVYRTPESQWFIQGIFS
ncbi:Y-family DNA polymerase [Lacimicrobium alkaliphilum]|uniref:Nucleotidyltransferase n=1 Tax=Lacimicrobium alkaliphilum TaxID=1526571 RepID=A0ABQ1RPX2_9ALTE|nr:DNA polymerase Y family protein [Lacimicrobium alkaliphilum]GGD77453.1 nucleotidyltransferase [Lacimicrobium alkaliphilum]